MPPKPGRISSVLPDVVFSKIWCSTELDDRVASARCRPRIVRTPEFEGGEILGAPRYSPSHVEEGLYGL
jgi:hypothetical protein